MLKFQINNSKSELSYKALSITDIIRSGVTEGERLIYVTSPDHKLRDNDNVRIECSGGEGYFENLDISVKDANTFYFTELPKVTLDIESVSKEYVGTYISKTNVTGFTSGSTSYTGGNVEYKLAMVLSLSQPHYFDIGDYAYDVKETIDKNYFDEDVEENFKKCTGDIVNFNGFCYYSYERVRTDHKYSLMKPCINYSAATASFTYGTTAYTIDKGYVSIDENGNIDRYKLYFFYDDDDSVRTQILDIIVANYNELLIQYDDTRYLTFVSGNTMQLAKGPNGDNIAYFSKETGNYHISLPFGETFTTDTVRDEVFDDNYVENLKETSINRVIDYEKQAFTPMYYDYNISRRSIDWLDSFDDKNLKPVNKITFNLHFRSRTDERDTNGNILKEWVVTDEKYWNNYIINSEGKLTLNNNVSALTDNPNKDQYGDLLSYLNFTDDDVYYQKGKLKKSFIRLSFYDSRDRATQTLQFYSTIFIDSGKMYTKYVTAKNVRGITEDVVGNEQISGNTVYEDSRLGMQFSASNKYDMSACSEGFYLYLFPDIVKGNSLTPLYMKVEFNHAKYGRIIPFSMPTYEKSSTTSEALYDIPIIDYNYFPIHYLDASGETINGVNISRLLNDTYIKVYVKYDFNSNQYVWFLPRTTDSMNGAEMIFNLWEPRINGFEALVKDYNIITNNDGNKGNSTVYGDEYILNIIGLNSIQGGTVVNMRLSISGTTVYNKTIIGAITSAGTRNEITTTIRIPSNSTSIPIVAGAYVCTDDEKEFTFSVLNYNGDNVLPSESLKHPFSTLAAGNVSLSKLVVLDDNKNTIRFYLQSK